MKSDPIKIKWIFVHVDFREVVCVGPKFMIKLRMPVPWKTQKKIGLGPILEFVPASFRPAVSCDI